MAIAFNYCVGYFKQGQQVTQMSGSTTVLLQRERLTFPGPLIGATSGRIPLAGGTQSLLCIPLSCGPIPVITAPAYYHYHEPCMQGFQRDEYWCNFYATLPTVNPSNLESKGDRRKSNSVEKTWQYTEMINSLQFGALSQRLLFLARVVVAPSKKNLLILGRKSVAFSKYTPPGI